MAVPPRSDVRVSSIAAEDVAAAKAFYTNSEEQPASYDGPAPRYAEIVTDLIASMRPESVLEFGCNAGRNLALLQGKCASAKLVGIDLNPLMIERGRGMFGLDLRVGDEAALGALASGSSDVCFTVSVLDHIPFPEHTIRELIRVSRRFIVALEIVSETLGRATEMTDAEGRRSPGYPFSYFHDYRYEFERKSGCTCLLDAYVPVSKGNLLDCYRLYLFSRQQGLLGRPIWETLRLDSKVLMEP